MPILPVPLPFDPAGGDLPVKGEQDVRDALPAFVRDVPSADAPVREALVGGATRMFLEWQSASAYAAAQADPTRATGVYLEGHAEDRGHHKRGVEDDEVLRARMLATPEVVTPEAILAVVNALLAPYTSVQAQYHESILDRWYVQDGTATWHSFIGAGPEYAARHYDERPQSDPGGAWAFDDSQGRYFVLRVPELTSINGAHMFVFDGSVPPDPALGNAESAWIADGSNTGGTEANGHVATFVSTGLGTALDVYQGIVDAVNAIRGAGVRWMLIADPNLT